MSEIHDAGRLEDHPFAELAGLIFREGRTGELTLESGQRRRSVWFLGGNPVAVLSADPRDHLAQFLVEHGKISADDAQRLATLPETRDALGRADYLPKETLTWGVKSRFVNLCYDLFRWDEGDYVFRDGDPPRDLFLLKVPAHSLIFKGSGFVSQSTVSEKVPDEAVCAPGTAAPDSARHLGPDMQRLLDECRPGRSVAEVIGSGWDDPDEARRMMYALQCLGLIALSPAAEQAQESEPGFSFDDGFGETEEPETATTAGREFGGDDLSLPGEAGGAGPQFPLPPFNDAAAPASGDFGAVDFPPGNPPAGGYPFDQEPAAGAFGSFGSDLNFDRGPEAPAATHPARGPKRDARPAGARFDLPRIAGIALGGIAAAALVGGAAWWWMSGGEPPPAPVKPPTVRPVPVPAPPPPAPASPAGTSGVQTRALPPAVTPAPAPAPSGVGAVTPPAPSPSMASAPQTARPAGAGTDRYRNALEIFRAGDIDGAAAVWESLLAEEHRDSYTLLLLTACQPETIREAQRTISSQRLYLLTKKVNGRTCFRVCAGTFGSPETASRALAELPGEFRSAGAAVRPVADVLKRDR